jgi:hypothetical protein
MAGTPSASSRGHRRLDVEAVRCCVDLVEQQRQRHREAGLSTSERRPQTPRDWSYAGRFRPRRPGHVQPVEGAAPRADRSAAGGQRAVPGRFRGSLSDTHVRLLQVSARGQATGGSSVAALLLTEKGHCCPAATAGRQGQSSLTESRLDHINDWRRYGPRRSRRRSGRLTEPADVQHCGVHDIVTRFGGSGDRLHPWSRSALAVLGPVGPGRRSRGRCRRT